MLQENSEENTTFNQSEPAQKTDSIANVGNEDLKFLKDNNFDLSLISKEDTIADTTTVKSIQGLFANHELREIHNNPQPINRPHQDWLFFVLLFIVISFTWLKVFYNKNFKQILAAIVSINATNQIVRDENILVQRASVVLTVMFNIVSSVLLYQASILFDWPSDYISQGFSRFLIFAVLISCVYSVKFLLLKLAGFVFRLDKPIANYIFNIFLINNILGVFLIPLLISITFLPGMYVKYIFNLAVIFVIVSFIYRLVRGIIIGLSQEVFSIFYLFLYLCTLEIAPLLILIKLFM